MDSSTSCNVVVVVVFFLKFIKSSKIFNFGDSSTLPGPGLQVPHVLGQSVLKDLSTSHNSFHSEQTQHLPYFFIQLATHSLSWQVDFTASSLQESQVFRQCTFAKPSA